MLSWIDSVKRSTATLPIFKEKPETEVFGYMIYMNIQKLFNDSLWRLSLAAPIPGIVPTNSYLRFESNGVTLIDTGYSSNFEALVSVLDSLPHRLKRIVITHGHSDHAGCAEALSARYDVPVYAHHNEIHFLEGRKSILNEPQCPCLLRLIGLARIMKLNLVDAPPVRANRINQDLHDLQREGLFAFHTPGHTHGSISILDERNQAILCGDNLDNVGSLRLGLAQFTLNVSERNNSVRAMLAAFNNASTVLAGHGGPYSSPQLSDDIERLILSK
jgi:glyoxylase-like metal-dependent hydrolase (beta-lactamase superfamily II)